MSIHPSDPNIAYAGTQDNGTLAYTGDLAWDEAVGGDGGWTAIDPAVPSIWYGSFFGISPYKLSGVTSVGDVVGSFVFNGGILANGIDTRDRRLFYVPIRMDPSNPVRLYYGTHRLYQSNDGAGNWAPISRDLTAGTGAISAIAVSPSLPKAVYVGTTNGKVQVTNGAEPGADPTWLDRSAGLPGRSVSQIAVDPLDPVIFYVTLSGFSGFLANDQAGHVFKTTDFGETFTDISGNLLNIPVNDIVVDPDLPNTLYVATDIGVFQSADGGQTWSTLSTGLPRVLVQGLNLHRPTRTLRAATYGRSMWDLGVPLTGPSLAPGITSLSPASLTAGANPVTIVVTGSNFVPTSGVRWNGLDRPTTFVNGTTLRVTLPASDLSKPGRATILVFSPVAGGGLSNSVNVPVGPAPGVTNAGIVSAANPSAGGPLVPGSIGSIFGTNLASDVVVAATPPLPYTLGDVTVEINGIPAPLFFVTPGQINFQTPWDVERYNHVTLRIINGTLVSSSLDVNVAAAAPALFSTNGNGSGQGAILIAGPEVLAAPADVFPKSRPVKPGETLEIYATGLGPVSRIFSDGFPYPLTGPPSITRTPVVKIGGAPATVLFSGLARGAVGLYQVNVTVPDDSPVGDAVPVSLSISGIPSNTVTVAVQSK